MKRILYSMITALLMLTPTACHYWNHDHGSGPSYTADFTTGVTGASPSVTLQKQSVNGSTVYLDIYVSGVSNLYLANIKVSYDATRVKWGGSYQAGSVLEANGGVTYLVGLDGGTEGTLVIGASLQGAATPVASATGVLVTIPFTVISTGASAIDFTLANLYDNGPAPVTVSSTTGGEVSGV